MSMVKKVSVNDKELILCKQDKSVINGSNNTD